MKFKLDENLDPRLAPVVAEGGHQVESVLQEGLGGKSDQLIYETCLREQRVLITLDLDFANPLRFPPDPTEGVVVLRPVRPVLSMIRGVLEQTLPTLKSQPLKGKLWIAEPGRIRVYDPYPE